MLYILANLPLIILSYSAGILLGHLNIFSITAPQIFFGYFLLALGYLATKNRRLFLCLLSATSFFSAFTLWQYQQQQFSNRVTLLSLYTLEIIGTITNKKDFQHAQQLEIKITQFRTTLNRTWRPINTSIIAYIANQQSLDIGDVVTIPQLSCAPPTNTLMQHRHVAGISFHTLFIKLVHHPHWNFKRALYAYKNQIVQQLQAKLNPQAYGLITSIFLGNPAKDNPFAYHDSFSWWGLNHYLARAGLHLIILLLILNFLTTSITTRFFTKTLLISAITTGYLLITWQNLPFVRAFSALICAQLCHVLKIPVHTLHLLNLIFFNYLLFDPTALFSLDFQLTFAITYCLLIIGRKR